MIRRMVWPLGSLLVLLGAIWLSLRRTRRQKSNSRPADQNLKPDSAMRQGSWQARLNRPVPALPVDLFRILVGVLSVAYFGWLYRDADKYSGPDGIIDHRITRRIFWYTRYGLFFPGMGLRAFRSIYLSAMGASVLLVAGIRPQIMGGLLFLTSVAAYRWFFVVMNVEDSIMHLVLFWTALLPTGRTLALSGLWPRPSNALKRWRQTVVPGATVRLFLLNIALAYLVAGLWKWTSRFWRQGIAVYVSLKTPGAWSEDRWHRDQLTYLKIANYFSLIIEPLLALMVFLPTGHPLKWLLAACAFVFHLGIVLTLRVPRANIAMMAALVLILREELAAFLGFEGPGESAHSSAPEGETIHRLEPAGRIGLGFLAILVPAMLWEARHAEWRTRAFRPGGRLYRLAERLKLNPLAGHHQNPFYAILWVLGFAQSYRLVDWIDERNHVITYSATRTEADGTMRPADPDTILPTSIRGALIKTYLHAIPWMKLKPGDLETLRHSFFTRLAVRYARRHPGSSRIAVYADIQHLSADNLDLDQARRICLMEFQVENDRVCELNTVPAAIAGG